MQSLPPGTTTPVAMVAKRKVLNCSVPMSSSGKKAGNTRGDAASFQLRVLWLLLALLFGTFGVTQCNDHDIYYPTSRLHLSIPTSRESYIMLRAHPLLNLSPPQKYRSERYSYAIESPVEHYLKIDANSGDVWIDSHFFNQRTNVTEFIISAKSRRNELRLSLTITPVPLAEGQLPNFCEEHLNDICFWESATYKIRENEPIGFEIGSIGPNLYLQLCRTQMVTYSLANATDYLSESNGSIYSNAILDHDLPRPGPLLRVGVQCTVQLSENAVPQQLNRIIDITVLDENDNRPRVEHVIDRHIELHLDDPHIIQDHPLAHLKVVFVDNDTIAVNNHVHYQLINDTYKLFQPNCTMYEINRVANIKQTIYACALIAQQSGLLPKGQYCVTLRAMDESVSRVVLHSSMGNVTICINPNHEKIQLPRPEALISGESSAAAAQPPRSGGKKARSSNKLVANLANCSYVPEVTLYNTSTQYARVAVPDNFYDQVRQNRINLEYRIVNNPLEAFGITEQAGIIYLKNVTSVRTQLAGVVLPLTVAWLNHTATIRIVLQHNTNNSCDALTDDFCSIHSKPGACNSSCGIGSREGSCHFRNQAPLSDGASKFVEDYPTCSPDLTFCPDNVCDPLEDMAFKLKYQICPQDCTPSNEVIGLHHIDSSRSRGIHMSSTPCTCRSSGQCECTLAIGIKPEHRKVRTKTTPTTTTSTELPTLVSNQTGESLPAAVRDGNTFYQTGLINGPHAPIYLLAIVLVPMIVAVLIVSYCFTRKVNLKKKLAEENSIPMHMVSNDTEVFNMDLPLNSRMNEINFKIDFDSKWEFPRANLILDVTLGEGEFGKVLKGYATDLPERPGITTVAVKMLKTGANSVELLALLSEYQLLQEVTHPNVIRLLGACTKGDSPLLIIEYCQYGSLKNYLRLSRKLDGLDTANYENSIEPITVKDILSFAWQISKGMAYLTEIKLVHRDLAARNVLLAEGKVCKISDFGLTRDVYEDDAYLKKSKDRVPVKWMAPESLADHIYTTKSDVWAFGVLCWELITLGASPYPGIPPQNLYNLLKQGYRMECPKNCSEEIYNIVRSCWADDPKIRPSFKHLAGQFEHLLGRSAKYVDMEQNSISNPVYCENNDETDCAKISFVKEEQARLESLWSTPQYESATDGSSTVDSFRYLSPFADKKALLLQSYDTPRPLIETATIEQKLRYENDVRLRPKKVFPNGVYPPSSTPTSATVYINSSSHPNLFSTLAIDETSFISTTSPTEYDSPSRKPRRVSYLDMNKNSVNLNLEINNIVDKKQSKDIAFRFSSSSDNNLQMIVTSSADPTSASVVRNDQTDEGDRGRDEVDFPCKKMNSHELLGALTVTSTV
ncbi:uncharacterized protein LOC129730641 [Wyeomyia smithii]|uniref:uncharacterized protein LOC129730641 n=1 Tax=Wyeomyia smithii TaxID=174621 RepID=UPI0024681D99|nr:uncharacterized protein LOC129730641 [Wyeomyia smithii]